MRKTTDQLITRLNEFHATQTQLTTQIDVSLAYNQKLPLIKKEQQRLLKSAKDVPSTFKYESPFDDDIEEVPQKQVFRVKSKMLTIPEEDNFKIEELPKREKGDADELKDVLKQAKKNDIRTEQVGQNYKETSEMLRKFVRLEVDVPRARN